MCHFKNLSKYTQFCTARKQKEFLSFLRTRNSQKQEFPCLKYIMESWAYITFSVHTDSVTEMNPLNIGFQS